MLTSPGFFFKEANLFGNKCHGLIVSPYFPEHVYYISFVFFPVPINTHTMEAYIVNMFIVRDDQLQMQAIRGAGPGGYVIISFTPDISRV